jgi:hypothetical protein
MPDEIQSLATTEAFQYLLQDYQGRTVPVVTAVFWGVGEQATAGEPWRLVFENGARLLRIQLMDTDAALAEWGADSEMSPTLQDLARSLYTRKVADPETPIILTPDQGLLISAVAKGEEGLNECRESLKEIGILFP